jgi:hypothetical protein
MHLLSHLTRLHYLSMAIRIIMGQSAKQKTAEAVCQFFYLQDPGFYGCTFKCR